MTAIALTTRESTILNCIVESYVKMAKPVGSCYLAKSHQLGISPATIRNVMNDLEEMGFLHQPHISAGRVPTDKGYRFYVDSLMLVKKLKRHERQIIRKNLSRVSPDVDEVLEVASQVLGEISSQLGVVLEPSFYQGIFQKIELVGVSENRIMAVISIKSGLVKTILMEIESEVSQDQLHKTSWIINERLSGLSLKEVKSSIDKRLGDVATDDDRLIRLIVASSEKLFNFENHKDLHLGGRNNIFSIPEFSDGQFAANILELIECKENILQRFEEELNDKTTIRIGAENKEHLLSACSVVTATYHVGHVSGTLGILGPTRMPYARIVPLVGYVGEVLTQTLSPVVC